MGLIQKVNINYLLPEMENEFKITGPNCTMQSRLLWGTFAKCCNYVFGMIAIILSSPPTVAHFLTQGSNFYARRSAYLANPINSPHVRNSRLFNFFLACCVSMYFECFDDITTTYGHFASLL